MLFWVIVATMLAACLAFLLAPLLRKAVRVGGRHGHEVAIYRDQLVEIGREVERGTISAADAKAAEVEVSRRLLASDRAQDRAFEPARQSGSSPRLAISIALLLPAATVGLYLALGAPQSLDRGLQPQAASLASLPEHRDTDLGQAVERLAARLQANPGDLDGWVLLARSKVAIGRFGEASEAYEAALSLADDDAELRSAYGESLVMAAEGIVTPRAKAAFEAAIGSRPGDPRGRYYLALAEAQAGRGAEAIEMWLALERESPAGAPWLPALRQRLEVTAEEYGMALALREAPVSRGPSTDDLRRAGQMSQAEQDEMIRGMVESLAARLQDQPDDLQGWLQLARAYQVLGEPEKARNALIKASAAAEKQGPEARSAVAQASRSLGAIGSPAAPTEAQSKTIQAIVSRLESDPGNAMGWLRLGRSYAISGEGEKARGAYGEALTRQPADLKLLRAYADATLETAALGAVARLPEPAIAVLHNLLAVDAGNPQALWLLGLTEAEAGKPEAAADLWRQLQESLPSGSPRRANVAAQIEGLAGKR